MNKLTLTSILFLSLWSKQEYAQAITPELEWEVLTAIGEGASDVVAFMDYTDDICMSGYWADYWWGVTSTTPAGISYFVGDDLGDDYVISSPFELRNMGASSFIYTINNEANKIVILSYDNVLGFVFHTIDLIIPSLYSQYEIVDVGLIVEGETSYHGILLKAFDITANKWKALFVSVIYDSLGDTATHEFIPILVGSWATFPSSITEAPGSPDHAFYIWGYFNKNAGGTNHDNFISKVHDDGEIYSLVYSKAHFSYAGRDDIATEIEMDNAGNLFCLSRSDDNVSPYSDHIAVFKFNPTNGKRLWIRRFGEAILGHEYGHSLTVINGAGPVFGGSYSDGQNARVWCLDNAGNTKWVKSVNMTGAGNIEEVMDVGICPASGDVNVIGYRSSDDTYFMARYNSNTGVNIWPVEVYDGINSGEVTNNSMQIDFSETGDIYLGYVVQSGPSASMITTKYTQGVLKNAVLSNDEKLSVSPNPASDFIHINISEANASIRILNMSGQILMEEKTNGQQVFDIRMLPAGKYIVQVYGANDITTGSFVK